MKRYVGLRYNYPNYPNYPYLPYRPYHCGSNCKKKFDRTNYVIFSF